MCWRLEGTKVVRTHEIIVIQGSGLWRFEILFFVFLGKRGWVSENGVKHMSEAKRPR